MKQIPIHAALIFLLIFITSFQEKPIDISSAYKKDPALASSYAPDVIDKWMAMQIKLMSTTIASFNGPFIRVYSYCGIAAFEAIRPGVKKNSPVFFSLTALNNIPPMPEIDPTKKYYWPASVNAALAFMNKAMFSFTGVQNKIAIDSLENTLKNSFNKETDTATLERSASFGRQVAQEIFEWSETDGYRLASNPFIPPSGPGKWIPTPPTYAKPVTPFWGNLRSIIKGSIENTQPPPPPPYSEDTTSDFYKMVKKVYDVDRNITPEQRNIALFWKDINPGFTVPGHWLSIIRQVFQKEKESLHLDKAAFIYAFTGMALNDAWISCWKTRYDHNLMRPVTYIRNVMGHREWLSMIPTPPHPEYTSGFAALAGAVSEALTIVLGNHYSLTDHTYDHLGFTPRKYDSFMAMAKEAGNSKFYGGIHYKLSVDVGLEQGRAVAKNIAQIIANNPKLAKP